MPAHWYSLYLSYINEPSLHVHPILPPRQRFQKNHEMVELPRIYFGHERGNLETGPHPMAEARPEEKTSSQILRSRPGVCCLPEKHLFSSYMFSRN